MALKDFLRIALVCFVVQKTGLRSSNVVSAQRRSNVLTDPMIYYTTTELACSEGYSIQEHTVISEDGFEMTVHRIPNGRNRPKMAHKKQHYHDIHVGHHPDFDECINESLNQTSKGFPILFVHALMMASDAWLLQGPGNDLAYIMADNGYDVWMANIRGSFYSRKHVSLSPSDPKFWNFSFHENAVSDIPATIDYILNVTKKEKLGYVGLSMGTTIFFAMNSMRPEYNDKIIGFVALAPVAYIKQDYMTNNPRRKKLFNMYHDLRAELEKRGVHEVFPRSSRFVNMAMNYCMTNVRLQDFCYDFLTVFMGEHSKLTLRKNFHLYLSHMPSGTSIKTFNHYGQNMLCNCFKLYDYGTEKNMELYGSPTPPDYPLWNITAPVALYYTAGDFYYDVRDVRDLMKVLPNVVDVDERQKFNHVDYLWAFKAKDTVYARALSLFRKLIDEYNFQTKQKKRRKADAE